MNITETDKPGKAETFLFNGGHLICAGSWFRRLHSHSFYQIIIVYQGSLTIEIKDKQLKTRPGDIVFYPKNTPHKEVNETECNAEIIYLDWEGPDPGFPELIHDREGRARIIAKWLLSDYKNSLYANQDEAEKSMLQTLLLEIEKNTGYRVSNFIRDVKSMIIDLMSEPLSLEVLSSKFRMNKFSFSKKYKKLTGRTPMDDVRRIRLEHAKDLVVSTDLSFNEIALTTGLTNEYHLSRIFKKYLGVPPGYFRKNH